MLTINEIRECIRAPRSSDDTATLDCVAELVGLPKVGDIPRPGQVANWSIDEWKEWAAPYGFVREDRSKHSLVLAHEKFPSLRIAKASSSGDIRSGLNLGQDVRRLIITELRYLAAMAACIMASEIVTKGEELTTAMLVSSLSQADNRTAWKPRVLKFLSAHVSEHSEELGKRLTSALAALGKYKMTPRDALNSVGVEADDAARMLTVLKSDLVPKVANLEDIVDALEDRLELERDVEAKEAAAKASRPLPVPEPKKESELDRVEIIYHAEVSRGKTRVKNMIATSMERITQLQGVLRGLGETLDEAIIPNFPSERFKELKAEAKDANEKLSLAVKSLDTYEATSQSLHNLLESANLQIAQLQAEKAETSKLFDEVASGPEWRAACTKLVAKLEPLLANGDFFALAQGVTAARTILTDAQKAIANGVAPTVV